MVAPSAQVTGNKLRLGIVGLGKMGQLHWRTWQRFSNVAVTALVDADPALAPWAAAKGIAFFRSHTELIGRVDAAVIATPAAQHASCALPLLTAGIHCLVEKPIVTDVIDGQRLVMAAARHGALLATGLSERFNPGMRHVRDEAATAVSRIEVFRMAPFWSSGQAGVDVVQDLMIHDLDWVIHVLGRIPATVQVNDARWLDGCLCSLSCQLGFAGTAPITLTASRLETARRRQVLLHGIDGRTRSVDLAIDWESPGPDPLTLQARAFLDALQGRASDIATGEEALVVTALGDRIRATVRQDNAPAL